MTDNPALAQQQLVFLLGRCAAGDQRAFRELYDQVSPHLFGVLIRMLGSRALAEEALQESFLKIWRKAASYNPSLGTPLSWLTGIARHQAIDLLRHRQSRGASGHQHRYRIRACQCAHFIGRASRSPRRVGTASLPVANRVRCARLRGTQFLRGLFAQ